MLRYTKERGKWTKGGGGTVCVVSVIKLSECRKRERGRGRAGHIHDVNASMD